MQVQDDDSPGLAWFDNDDVDPDDLDDGAAWIDPQPNLDDLEPPVGRTCNVIWYQQRLDSKLFAGSPTTLRQHLYNKCVWKRHGNITDTAFESSLQDENQTLPQPNLAPPYFYLVKK